MKFLTSILFLIIFSCDNASSSEERITSTYYQFTIVDGQWAGKTLVFDVSQATYNEYSSPDSISRNYRGLFANYSLPVIVNGDTLEVTHTYNQYLDFDSDNLEYLTQFYGTLNSTNFSHGHRGKELVTEFIQHEDVGGIVAGTFEGYCTDFSDGTAFKIIGKFSFVRGENFTNSSDFWDKF